jgi:hypothetical protein
LRRYGWRSNRTQQFALSRTPIPAPSLLQATSTIQVTGIFPLGTPKGAEAKPIQFSSVLQD